MKPGYGTQYRRHRAALLADSPPCALRLVCDGAPAVEVDHEPPLSAFDDPESWVGVLRPTCVACNRAKGGADARRLPEPSRVW